MNSPLKLLDEPLYRTQYGNSNRTWNHFQVTERATIRSHREAIEYLKDRNQRGGHDLYYLKKGQPEEGYLEEAHADHLTMWPGGIGGSDDTFEVFYDDIDWDLLLYWPKEGHPVRVEFTFDPEAPELYPMDPD